MRPMIYYTERLILKTEGESSCYRVMRFYADNKDIFEKYEPSRCENFYTLSYHRKYLHLEVNEMMNNRMLRLWIYKKTDPSKIIGTICFSNIIQGVFYTASLGYKLGALYQGHGYATEACRKGIEIMFEEFALHRIEARVMPSNHTSLAVMKRLGFHFEGLERQSVLINHHWEDHMRFSLLNSTIQ